MAYADPFLSYSIYIYMCVSMELSDDWCFWCYFKYFGLKTVHQHFDLRRN